MRESFGTSRALSKRERRSGLDGRCLKLSGQILYLIDLSKGPPWHLPISGTNVVYSGSCYADHNPRKYSKDGTVLFQERYRPVRLSKISDSVGSLRT